MMETSQAIIQAQSHNMKNMALIFLVTLFAVVGCRSTEAHRANHQSSINENMYVTQFLRQHGDQIAAEVMPHMEQQLRHLVTTQQWLGPADTEIPHDHQLQEGYRKQADADTQAAGIVGELWSKAKANWPWLGIVSVLGGLAGTLYRKYKQHETIGKQFIAGIQDAKEKARGNGGHITAAGINEAITRATHVIHDPEIRAVAKDIIRTTKEGLRDVKKEIDAVRDKDNV